jgi:hypothetical protein
MPQSDFQKRESERIQAASARRELKTLGIMGMGRNRRENLVAAPGHRAAFVFYGPNADEDRIVRFYSNNNELFGVDIEGMPSMTVNTASRSKALVAFKTYYAMAMKEHGASRINWGEMLTEDEFLGEIGN